MIDTLSQHIMRSYEETQEIMYIPSDLPYYMASRILRQGIKCDRLAREIRRRLPEFLESIDKMLETEKDDAYG